MPDTVPLQVVTTSKKKVNGYSLVRFVHPDFNMMLWCVMGDEGVVKADDGGFVFTNKRAAHSWASNIPPYVKK